MKVIIKENALEASKVVSEMIANVVKTKEKPVLGLATGSTPLQVYVDLIEKKKNSEISFKNTIAFNLDEYAGLEPTHEQSYKYFMNINLFDKIDILKENCHIPSEYMTKPEQYKDFTIYKAYDDAIAHEGGIDIQLLGIGLSGHVGFNEPGEAIDYTHTTSLHKSTIEANSRFFNSIDEVPTHAITMGMKSISNAKSIVLLATGSSKADIINKMINAEVSEDIPATLIRNHNDITIVLDKDAAALL